MKEYTKEREAGLLFTLFFTSLFGFIDVLLDMSAENAITVFVTVMILFFIYSIMKNVSFMKVFYASIGIALLAIPKLIKEYLYLRKVKVIKNDSN